MYKFGTGRFSEEEFEILMKNVDQKVIDYLNNQQQQGVQQQQQQEQHTNTMMAEMDSSENSHPAVTTDISEEDYKSVLDFLSSLPLDFESSLMDIITNMRLEDIENNMNTHCCISAHPPCGN